MPFQAELTLRSMLICCAPKNWLNARLWYAETAFHRLYRAMHDFAVTDLVRHLFRYFDWCIRRPPTAQRRSDKLLSTA